MNSTDSITITSIDSITLEVADPEAARRFYADAFGLDSQVRLVASDAPTSGFRGFTVSLVVSQPANVRALFDAAVAAGATVLKPVEKSLWGVGGVVQAPDGSGSHRIRINSDGGSFTDPDGFEWRSAGE